MERDAYPQGYKSPVKPPFNLEKWKDIATKIKVAARDYPDYSEQELVEYFTRKWECQERESFGKWWLYQTKRGQQDMTMQKVAYDYGVADKERQLNEMKKKLRSRVNSAERLLNKMVDEGLLSGNDAKALYIGRILQKLKEEINLLKQPQLIAARHQRAGEICQKAGLVELADIIKDNVSIVKAFQEIPLIKTASPKYETLKEHKVSLTDEERAKVMEAGAVWHHGPNGEETSAIWKAKVDDKIWYGCNTHRAVQIKDTLAKAIKAFDFIKTTASIKTAQESGTNIDSVLQSIKQELDIFNYGVHLDKMMQIRGQLIALNRHSEASMVLDIIKKDLDDLDGIHKKLVELYTSLSQIPLKAQVTKTPEPRIQSRPVQPGV